MKVIFTTIFFLVGCQMLLAQKPLAQNKHSNSGSAVNFNGQWKGDFNETSRIEEENIGYVLELTTEGNRVFGYSYSYFKEFGNSYFTICRLTGTLNPETREIVVTEIERTKYNTPPTFVNCFQTHRLRYEKGPDNTEILKGTWEPAPGQGVNCGKGITVLSRRIVNRTPLGVNRNRDQSVGMTPTRPAPRRQTTTTAPKKIEPPVIAKTEPKEEEEKKAIIPFPKSGNDQAPEMGLRKVPVDAPKPKLSPKLESRRADVVKTIAIESPTFRLDFYDNGEIDGDSISVFFNGKAILSNQMLTDKPITLTLSLDPDVHENTIVMYAENLGTIPPNTAVMIVTDGKRRYEVRMESDLKKSGSVIFVPKK
ncbi:MAG: hypothetical protein ABIN48_11950 [Ginsengibacter sp.]